MNSRRIIKKTNQETHQQSIDEMSKFFESDKPQLGIFWFNPAKYTLFGVLKDDAEMILAQGHLTYPKLHKTFWQKQHRRAVAHDDRDSMFYGERDYTLIPRGRIFLNGNKYVVKVGNWISELDIDRFSALVQDEFNLPDDFEFEIDEHWDLGRGWSEEQF